MLGLPRSVASHGRWTCIQIWPAGRLVRIAKGVATHFDLSSLAQRPGCLGYELQIWDASVLRTLVSVLRLAGINFCSSTRIPSSFGRRVQQTPMCVVSRYSVLGRVPADFE